METSYTPPDRTWTAPEAGWYEYDSSRPRGEQFRKVGEHGIRDADEPAEGTLIQFAVIDYHTNLPACPPDSETVAFAYGSGPVRLPSGQIVAPYAWTAVGPIAQRDH